MRGRARRGCKEAPTRRALQNDTETVADYAEQTKPSRCGLPSPWFHGSGDRAFRDAECETPRGPGGRTRGHGRVSPTNQTTGRARENLLRRRAMSTHTTETAETTIEPEAVEARSKQQ